MTTKSERLRQARTKAGFESAADAARALEVPVPTYTAHENGVRGFSDASARRYARRFRVSPAWLTHGETTGGKGEAKPGHAGLAEPEVEPLDMKSAKPLLDMDNHPHYVAPYKASAAIRELGIHKGSVLFLDLKTPPQTGDLVVASLDDRDIGTSTSIVRQLVGRHLVGSPLLLPIEVTENVTVRGKIVRIVVDF